MSNIENNILDDVYISVIMPIYNEADNIDELCQRLSNTLGTNQHTYEIIFVDDGSTDNSLNILKKIRQLIKKLEL